MYIASVLGFMFILPIASVIIESLVFKIHPGTMLLIGKWFVFWGIGGRLGSAGLKQAAQPGFTAKEIFDIKDKAAFIVVQELGFVNICLGAAGIWSLWKPAWVLPVALIGGLYYGLAGARHLFNKHRNTIENFATYTDLYIFLVLIVFFVSQI